MRTRRLKIVGVVVALVIGCAILILLNFGHHAESKQIMLALQGVPYDRLDAAVKAFTRDRKVSGRPLPDAVPLREFISGGYLRTNDIHGLEDKDVTVSLAAADETAPNVVLIRVRTAAGLDIVLLSDGSIREVRRQ